MTYKNILQKGAFAALITAGLMMTVSCNDDDVSPVLEERVLVKEINLEVTSELPLLIGRLSTKRWYGNRLCPMWLP